jgi:hypothetical protein
MRRLSSKSPSACRRPIRDSAKRAANIAPFRPIRRQLGNQFALGSEGLKSIQSTFKVGHCASPPTKRGPQFGAARPGAVRTSRGRLARSATADHNKLTAAVQFCSDQAEKKGYDFLASTIRRREGAMTPAEQAFLLTGVLFCLSFATIFVFWFADRLRSNFLGKR